MALITKARSPTPPALRPSTAPHASKHNMKCAVLCTLGILVLSGCRPHNPTPNEIRQHTANATRTAVRDAKAITQGIFDGIRSAGPVNLNTASRDQLKALPGIDDARAARIVAHRPYDHAGDLLKKHVLTKSEFERIDGQVKPK